MKTKLIMILFFSFIIFSCSTGGGEKVSKKEKPQEIQVEKVVFEDIPDFVEATGFVQPDKEGIVKVTSRTPGTLQSIKVRVGERVRAGQILAVVKAPDTTDLYAQKLSLSAQLSQAEKLLKIKRELYEVGAIPKSELIEAETSYEVIKAQLRGVEERLKILGGGMGISNIISPIDGVVYQILAHVGDPVDQATEILSIANPLKIVITALIADRDLPKIKVGDKVDFFVSTYPQRKFEGKVKYVSDVLDPETHRAKVYIEPSEKEPFKINMFFNVNILVGEERYAVIPKRALLYQNGKFYVFLLEDGKVEKKEVNFVKELEDGRVALLGIQEGQKVISNPILEVSP
jgi:cobalt-zinc-cadmium efflux system membrane fusion protein